MRKVVGYDGEQVQVVYTSKENGYVLRVDKYKRMPRKLKKWVQKGWKNKFRKIL